ncbi:unnamed protein product [Ostreobium quekettii]|uniref:Uncharacterized protein n=1 Tax=Ostreobium quekettii TaxID=121088 RepID=A0A8S1INY0_9CHLO|nr:unnamed protein product [Ostreobium quekettii]|eukprot:evm.model.scf_67.6 EVM.evm.TU.scf_67.6   scf_67:75271-82632(-)
MSQQVFREVERGNLVAVRKLLASNPNCVNIVNAGENRTPLHVASWHGFDHIVKQLLQHSARHEAQDRFGNTPLHLACDSGSVETVQQLLGPGRNATVRIKNRDGQTPLHVAVLGGLEDVVKELLAAGAKTDVKDKEGHTPIEYVPEHFETLIDLLKSKPSTPQEAAKPRTPRGQSDSWKSLRQASLNGQPLSARKNSRISSSSPDSKQSTAPVSPRPLSARRRGRQSSSPEPKQNGAPATPQPLSARRRASSPEPKSQQQGRGQTQNATRSRSIVLQNSLAQKSLSRESMKAKASPRMATKSLPELHRELKELHSRMELFEDAFAQSKEESGEVQVEIDGHDRQLAELDQRLSLHESHLREVRPQVQELGKDARRSKDQYDHFQWAVQSWRESVQSQLDLLDSRVKDLEEEEGHCADREELRARHVEQADKLTRATQQIQNSLEDNAELQKQISSLRARVGRIETSAVESTSNKDKDATGVVLSQVTELAHQLETLQSQVDRTAKRSDRVEKLYTEHMEAQLNRKAEQERELSERESKILDLRRMALEEENHRRQLCEVQEEHKTKMRSLEQKVEALLELVPGGASALDGYTDSRTANHRLTGRVQDLEGQIHSLRSELAAQQVTKTKTGCCVIS